MNVDHNAHNIPFDLEAPVPIMFWEPLEFTLAICLMGFGILANMWIVGVLGGAGILLGSRYMKRGAKRGAMQHWLWARGLAMDKPLAQRFKASYLNDFVQ